MTLKRNSITESEDDQIERETFSGKRSIDDLKQMMRCRDRATQEAARQALVLARTETSGRGLGQTIKAPN
jgi:hypothetical protein